MLQSLALIAVSLVADAAAVDHAPLQQVLSAHVSPSGQVDYAAIQASGALDAYLDDVARAALPASDAERLALWINAYNALTIDLVADAWPLSSIMELDGGKVWSTRRYTVAGESLTLDELENQRIRPLGDARIHAAVNCASMGCPPLARTVFEGASLQSQLDAAAVRWVAGNAVVIDRGAGTARFNQIFDWYGEDFVGGTAPAGVDGELGQAAAWAARYASPEVAAWLRAGGYRADWNPYSWAVNGKPGSAAAP